MKKMLLPVVFTIMLLSPLAAQITVVSPNGRETLNLGPGSSPPTNRLCFILPGSQWTNADITSKPN